jgi:hypothetical protein
MMRLIVPVVFVFFGFTALSSLRGDSDSHKALPERVDCIAGAELMWDRDDIDRVAVLNQIGDVFNLVLAFPVAAEAVQERRYVYMIFTENCEAKDLMMEQIMEVLRHSIDAFPGYRIIQEPIFPSPRTIQAWGDEWSDGAVE